MIKGFKKYLVGITSGAMLLGTLAVGTVASAATSVTPGSAPFSDVNSSTTPYANAIDFLEAAGVINGVGGGLYQPNTDVTRAQMAKIVVDMLGDANFAQALSYTTPSFTDASTIPTWAIGDVNLAASLGIINGFPDGSFQPNAPVTIVEAEAMILRALNDESYVKAEFGNSWPGSYVIASGSAQLSNSFAPQGLVTGLQGNIANAPATRGQVAQLVYEGAVNEVYGADQNCSGTPTTCTLLQSGGSYVSSSTGKTVTMSSLWQQGVNGISVIESTITSWSYSSVTTAQTGSAAQNLNTGYLLLNAPGGLASLVGEDVVVLEPGAGSAQVNAILLQPTGVTLPSGVLPTGYEGTGCRLANDSGSLVSWLITNSTCSSSVPTYTPYLQLTNKLIEIASGANVYVNVASGGPTANGSAGILAGSAAPSSLTYNLCDVNVGRAEWSTNCPSSNPAKTYAASSMQALEYALENALVGGNTVQYTVNSSGDVTNIYAETETYGNAVITGTSTSGNGSITIAEPNGSGGVNTQTLDNETDTQVTVNGVASSFSDLKSGMIVDAWVIGDGFNGTQLDMVNAYNATATGTVTQVNEASNGNVTSFQLTDSSGTVTTYNLASQTLLTSSSVSEPAATALMAAEQSGAQFTVSLNGSGDVVELQQVGASLSSAAVWVTNVSYSQSTSSATYTATVTNGITSTTLSFPGTLSGVQWTFSAASAPTGAPSGAACATGPELYTEAHDNGNLFPTIIWDNLTSCIQPGAMTQVSGVYNNGQVFTQYDLGVEATSGGADSVVLGVNDSCNGWRCTGAWESSAMFQLGSKSNPGTVVNPSGSLYLSGNEAAVIGNSGGNLGYSGLVLGDQVKLYTETVGSDTFYAVQDGYRN